MNLSDFNFDIEIKKFEKKFGDLKINTELFKSGNGKEIIVHFLEEYSGLSNVLINNGTFMSYIYPYIEFSHKEDATLAEAKTLIAQDFQSFNK